MNWMFSNVNLNSPVKRQKALYFPPTGCSPPIFVASLWFMSQQIQRSTEVLLSWWYIIIIIYVICVHKHILTEGEKTNCSFPGGTCYSTLLLLQASKHPALAGISMMAISFHSAKIFAEVKVTEERAVQAASSTRNQKEGRVGSWGRFTLKQPFALSLDSQKGSLTSSIPRLILKSDSSFPSVLQPHYSPSTPKPGGWVLHSRLLGAATHEAARGSTSGDAGLASTNWDYNTPFISP